MLGESCSLEEEKAAGRKTTAHRNISLLHMAIFRYTEEACNLAQLGKPGFPQPPSPRAWMSLSQERWDTVGSI